MANANNNGFWKGTTPGEDFDPLIRSPVHTGDRTRSWIKDIVPIMKNENRKAMERITAIAGRKPNEQVSRAR